jgi:hypothetical protein
MAISDCRGDISLRITQSSTSRKQLSLAVDPIYHFCMSVVVHEWNLSAMGIR